jgi:TolB-like protein
MSAEPARPGFLAELKRRNVFRVAGVYAAVGFVLVQVANNFFPALHLPAWTTTFVAVLVVIGFPIALILAWALELTPDGLRRETPAAPALSPNARRRWLVQRIAAAGGAVVLALAGGAFLLGGGADDAARGGDTVANDVSAAERSIAVLPFANLSADAENEYFSDGITDNISGRLSRMGGLRVTSRTSAMSYRGTTRTAREIGQELGVAYLLEGSVRRAGDRLRVSVQLVDARTDRTHWSEEYDRQVTDVFAIQSEIAERIADALRIRLSSGDRARLGHGQTDNLASYDLYLRATELLRRRAPGIAERNANTLGAVALLRQAAALDPDYALPWAFLAWAYETYPGLPLAARRDSSRSFADRVIRMAPDLPDGYAELGWLYMTLNDRERAGEQFRLALARDPNHEVTLAGMRDQALSSGRFAEALDYARRTVEVAPTDAGSHAALARVHAMIGDFDAAERLFRKAWFDVVQNPTAGYCELADIAVHRGDRQMARQHLDALLEHASGEFSLECAAYLELSLGNMEGTRSLLARGARNPMGDEEGVPRLLMAVVALHDGNQARADTLLSQEETRLRAEWELCDGRCGTYQLARLRALQGRTDEAIAYLQRTVETGWSRWYPSRPDPFLTGIESDPRYQAILAGIRTARDRERAAARP